jgi:peptidyl-prolyl cis-trans isomerase D
VTDAELRAYYEENREDFRQPATALVTLVELMRVAQASDSAAALERARNLWQEAVDGADFAELASANSADAASAAQGGDLGWFGRGDMTPPFEAAAFDLEPGQISEPVLTNYGYHIIKVAEKEEDRVRASHILLRIEMAGESEERLLATVDRLERVALKNGLDAAIDSTGTTGSLVTLTEGSDFVPGIGPFSPATGWAFHDSTFIGDVSPIYETDQGFHVFELVQRAPESYLTYEDAEASVRRRLLSEKKIETSRWQAEQIAAELASGSSLEEVAATRGMDVQTTDMFSRLDFVPGLGQYNKVIGAAFGSELGKTSGPFESGGRLYFLHVVDRVEASREAFAAGKETLRAQLTMQRRESAVNEWLADLREQADIQDWRKQVFVPRS